MEAITSSSRDFGTCSLAVRLEFAKGARSALQEDTFVATIVLLSKSHPIGGGECGFSYLSRSWRS